MAEFAYNNAYHEAIKTTPFRLTYGFDPSTPRKAVVPRELIAGEKAIALNVDGVRVNFDYLRATNARFHSMRSESVRISHRHGHTSKRTYPRNVPTCEGYAKYYAIVDGQLVIPQDDAGVVRECPAARKFSSFMQQQLQLARRCLDDAKQRQRAYMQKSMEDTAFQQGEYVWLSTLNLRRRFAGTPKLMPRYVGPFKVVKLVGETSYKLDLGETGKRLHDVFHSSLLRRHKGPIPEKVSPIVLDGDADKRGERYEVERILKHRCKYRTRPKADGTRTEKVLDDVQYLIRWKGFDDLHDTWEPSAHVDGADTALREYWQKWVSQNPSETPPVSLLALPGVA
jgi:hypothetical protein